MTNAIIEVAKIADSDGRNVGSRRNDVFRMVTFVYRLLNGTTLGPFATTLADKTEAVADAVTIAAEVSNPVGLKRAIDASVRKELPAPFQAFLRAATERLADNQNRRHTLGHPVSDPATAAIRAERRSAALSMSTPDLVRACDKNAALREAVLELPEIFPLSNDLIERLRERQIIHTLAERFASNHRRRPTPSTPVVIGVDMDGAMADAKVAFKQLATELDEVEDAKVALTTTVEFAANLLDVTLEEALAILMGEN